MMMMNAGYLLLPSTAVHGFVVVVLVGQLSLLASVGRKMSTGQSAVMLCGWEVWFIALVDARVSGR